ncbi:HTH-type transcriptional regulator YodB [Nocardia cerradoensis]|uniref:HTH-type transcriptional regulator YodB n=1 Tax=Nocardia cerradoensis TaxID=85688 RepID=A0A231HB10_9NOCA|nr:helix-turn-helix domain-containing protein [Nocardia cerradoensis]OXR45936.1 HTH-type transcriptional regulator YodB [Nocardia cerradoensis]
MPRRTYDHYCPVSRALEVVGDRWNLLLVRELCSGPRRYSDLFADLPGISTDILAARLKDLERDGILTHRKMGSRSAAAVYELTPTGAALRPVLQALSEWGAPLLGDRRATDAVRAHWFALPLGRAIADVVPAGTVTVYIGDTALHYVIGAAGISHHEGPAPAADHEFRLAMTEATEIATGARHLADVVGEPGRGGRSYKAG